MEGKRVKFASEQITKVQTGRRVQLYSFFNLGAGWGGWSTPRPSHFTPQKRAGTHRTRKWVDARAGLHGCGKSRPLTDSIPVRSYPLRVSIPTELSRPTGLKGPQNTINITRQWIIKQVTESKFVGCHVSMLHARMHTHTHTNMNRMQSTVRILEVQTWNWILAQCLRPCIKLKSEFSFSVPKYEYSGARRFVASRFSTWALHSSILI